jgi:brefeldin A-inhibited guanine nucleotide-exchange protein
LFFVLQVKPIIVADMLSTAGAKTSLADISGMTAAVQGFLNNVVAAAGYGAATETPEQLKQSVAAAIIGPRHSMELPEGLAPAAAATGAPAAAAGGSGGGAGSAGATAAALDGVSSSDEEEDEKNTFHLAPATSSEVAAAAGGSGSSSGTAAGSSDATHLGNGNAAAAARGGAPSQPADGSSAASSSSSKPSVKLAHAGSSGASSAFNQGKALLLKDAFLVFRALCKLSIRTSDTLTISDPTAVRGKVCADVGLHPCALQSCMQASACLRRHEKACDVWFEALIDMSRSMA